jgi:hypothetical protein
MVEVSGHIVDEAAMVEKVSLLSFCMLSTHSDLQLKEPDFDSPSHSILAKDHLSHILNGPCGQLALM